MEENSTVVYDILGERFEVTRELYMGLKIFQEFNSDESEKKAYEHGERVYQQLGSFDAVFAKLPGMLYKWRDQVLDQAVDTLMRYGVYDYDHSRLIKMGQMLGPGKDICVEQGENNFAEIMGHILEEPDYVISQLKEPCLEVLKQTNNPREIKALSKGLYQDDSFKNCVSSSYFYISCALRPIVISVLEQADVIEVYDFQSDRAKAICENCKKNNNLNREQQRRLLSQAFFADPLNADVVAAALDLGLDDSGDLAEFAKQVGITIGNAGPQSNKGPNQINNNTASGSNQASNDAVKVLCNKFLLSHNASLFKCTPKLKAALGIANMDDSDIYLARDDTVLKTGRNGFAITKDGIYCRDIGAKATHISYEMLGCASRITKKLGGTICADKTVIALSTESTKDLILLFTNIAKAVR